MLGKNIIGAGVECEDLKEPYVYYKALASKSLVVSIGVFKFFTLNISPNNILPPAYLFRIVGRGGDII